MSKYCKECGKEIPQTSKKDVCEHHQNKKYRKIRKIAEFAGGILLTVGSIFLFIVTKGKLGGPKA